MNFSEEEIDIILCGLVKLLEENRKEREAIEKLCNKIEDVEVIK